MNARIEKTVCDALRAAALLPASAWQIEPATSGGLLDPAKDWCVPGMEENERVVGPLWRGVLAIQFFSVALAEGADPAAHIAAVESVLAWLEQPAAAVLAALNATAADCAFNGFFVAGAPRPEQQDNRWVSAIRVTCGWSRI